MAEWPKLHLVEHSGNPDDGETFRHVEVVPADLARELYERLCELAELNEGSADHESAIQRYRREVKT